MLQVLGYPLDHHARARGRQCPRREATVQADAFGEGDRLRCHSMGDELAQGRHAEDQIGERITGVTSHIHNQIVGEVGAGLRDAVGMRVAEGCQIVLE